MSQCKRCSGCGLGWLLVISLLLSGCLGSDHTVSGKACLGPNNDALVESLSGACKAGDAIATKHPAYFCDFRYAVAYNEYNSAFCIYVGELKPERISGLVNP
ncbi:MAG: hypothetical protein P8176_04495 [Gammaproteobacteria bacterium]